VAWLARLRPPAAGAPTAEPPLVCAVVASRDDPAAVAARVADLLASDYAPGRLRVVVGIDATSADQARAVAEVARLAPGATVVAGDAPGGKAATLNAAVRAAGDADVLVFSDTGQRFAPGTVAALVAALADPRVGAVSGLLELPEGGSPTLAERYWRYERRLREQEARLHSAVGVTGAVYGMRRALWSPLPAGLILDDVYVPMRLVLNGYRVAFSTAARARDTRRFASGQEYRRKVRTLTGVIQLCAWLPAVLVPGRNPIWVQFLFHKLLRLLTPYLALAMVVGAAGLALRALRFLPPAVPFGVLAALTLALVALPALRRRLVHQVGAALSLQAAIVVATVNGIRGRWNVW
jgi:cellulose synthase/poly-beta-1,6-N-acetylglucosamine synthase-like glycosyltransferase